MGGGWYSSRLTSSDFFAAAAAAAPPPPPPPPCPPPTLPPPPPGVGRVEEGVGFVSQKQLYQFCLRQAKVKVRAFFSALCAGIVGFVERKCVSP